MNVAINAWAIMSPTGELLLHSISKSRDDSWGMLFYREGADGPTRREREAMGFRPVMVRIKYEAQP